MKIILSFLFIVSSSSFAAETCDELQLNLLSIESRLLNSKLRECSSSDDTLCRRENINNLTYSQVQRNYNKALADLVIHQGIAAITSAIQGSHNSIAGLDQKQITKAEKYIETLEDSVTKAEIVSAATTAVQDVNGSPVSFWYKNGYHADIGFEEFEGQLRENCTQNTEAICSKKELFDNPKYLQTIYGFAKSELNSRTIVSSDPTDFYNDINEQLKITVKNKDNNFVESLTPQQYRAAYLGDTNTIGQLKKTLKNLQSARSDEFKNGFKDHALILSKSLANISTSYGVIDKSDSSVEGSVSSLLSANFQKPFKDLEIDLAGGHINDLWKKNFETNLAAIKGDQNALKAGFNLEVERLLEEDNKSDLCEFEESAEGCFDRVCAVKDSCTISGAVNLKKKAIEDKDKLQENFEAAYTCYDKKSLEAKKSCLENAAKKLNPEYTDTTKADLQEKVKSAKQELEKYKSSQPILSIGEEKLLAISALELHPDRCLEETTLISNTCRQNAGASTLNGGVLSLNSELGDISIHLNQSVFDKAKGKSRSKNDSFTQNGSDFIKQCSDDDKPGDICSFYSDKQARTQKFVQNAKEQKAVTKTFEEKGVAPSEPVTEQERRAFKQREANYYNSFNNNRQNTAAPVQKPFNPWLSGLSRGLFQPNPISGRTGFNDLLGGTFGLLNTKVTTDLQIDQIRNQSNLFDTQLDFYRNNLPPYRDVFPFNGGFIHSNFAGNSSFINGTNGSFTSLTNPLISTTDLSGITNFSNLNSFNSSTSLNNSNIFSIPTAVAPPPSQTFSFGSLP